MLPGNSPVGTSPGAPPDRAGRCRWLTAATLATALALSGCARQPVAEMLKWEQKCGPGAAKAHGPPPPETLARPLRDAFLANPRCGPVRSCAADADLLARVMTRIARDYVVSLAPETLLAAATEPLRPFTPLQPETNRTGLLEESLDRLFALLDARSEYWLLDAQGRTQSRGQGPPSNRPAPTSSGHRDLRWRVLAPGVGYLAVGRFEADIGRQLEAAVIGLKSALGGSIQAAVLDLRGNGGGLLGAGVNLASGLLRGGPVVRVDGRSPENRLRFRADDRDLLDGAPLLVLIDGGTASAAEIVAGALQDRGRARLLGTQSYGKGSVQSLYLPSCRLAMKITTARYTTPGGQQIDGRGLLPDIAYPRDCPHHAGKDDPLLACALTQLPQVSDTSR